MGKLDGKVCILTGAASGLGRPEALLLAEEGARGIAICDIQEEKLMETKRLCEEAGAEVIAIPMDVRDVNKLQELVDATVEKWGTVDVLVNNVHCTTLIPFVDQKAETMQREFEISYFSTWHLMQMCYPYLKDKPGAGASIINFGS